MVNRKFLCQFRNCYDCNVINKHQISTPEVIKKIFRSDRLIDNFGKEDMRGNQVTDLGAQVRMKCIEDEDNDHLIHLQRASVLL
jgi:hypothetical protein